jgi:hypothetical protein
MDAFAQNVSVTQQHLPFQNMDSSSSVFSEENNSFLKNLSFKHSPTGIYIPSAEILTPENSLLMQNASSTQATNLSQQQTPDTNFFVPERISHQVCIYEKF